MSASFSETAPADTDLQVPLADVIRFIRQLSHDLRNQLNAAELQSAYLKEIADDGEVKDEIQRLRAMLGELGTSLQRLTAALAAPKLTQMPYAANAFVEDFKQKVAAQFPEKSGEITWEVNAGNGSVEIDPQLLQQAILELITNAFQHGRGSGPIRVHARAGDGELALSISEPKAAFTESTEQWGREPFRKVKHGHYGLGLLRARKIIEAHRGRLEARHDSSSSSLVTTVFLPLAEKDND